jgi:DNA-directed RNA polymerase subunit RPC12/RpoP
MGKIEDILYFCNSCGDDFSEKEDLYQGECSSCREDKSENREW